MSETACLKILGVFFAEATVVVLFAALLSCWVKPYWQRTFWHAVMIVLLGVLPLEGFGIKWSLPSSLPSQSRPVLIQNEEAAVVPPLPIQVLHSGHLKEFKHVGPRQSLQTRRQPVWWPWWIWMSGILLFAVRPLAARVWFVLQAANRKPLMDGAMLVRTAAIARNLGIQRRIRVMEAHTIETPVAFGLLRPSICLPRGFSKQFSPVQQESMLAHELEHLRAHDPFWYLLTEIACALWWWHPLVWWSRRSLQAATEQAADEASLLIKDGPVVLAECLVQMGQKFAVSRSFNSLGMEGNGFRSGLARRVTRLLKLPPGAQPLRLQHSRVALVHFSGGLILLMLVLLGSGWSSREAPIVPALWSAVLAQVRSEPSPRGPKIPAVGIDKNGLADASATWEGTTSPEMLRESNNTEPTAPIASPQAPLYTRWFKVDFDALRREITNALQITDQSKPRPPEVSRSGLYTELPKENVDFLFNQLLQYLKQLGVDLNPPKNLFYNDRLAMIMVRGTLKDLDIIERSLHVSNLRASMVVLEVKWAEFDAQKCEQVFNSLGLADYTAGSFVNMPPRSGLVTSSQNKIYSGSNPPLTWMRVLTRNQCNAMFRKLEASPGVNVIGGPRLLTFNDNTAHVQVADGTRPSLDMVSHVMVDGYTLRLNATQTLNEFVGYNLDGKKDVWDYVESAGANPAPKRQYSQNPLAQQLPVPVYRLRQENAQAVLWDGQTMVFWGARQTPPEPKLKDRVPLLGDLSIVGKMYQMRPDKRTESLIFITATVVDEAGKRVHEPADLPFSENAVPAQNLKR